MTCSPSIPPPAACNDKRPLIAQRKLPGRDPIVETLPLSKQKVVSFPSPGLGYAEEEEEGKCSGEKSPLRDDNDTFSGRTFARVPAISIPVEAFRRAEFLPRKRRAPQLFLMSIPSKENPNQPTSLLSLTP